MHGSTACIGMEVMKYTATPKARETGSGMPEPKTGSFCQGGIIYAAFEAPVTQRSAEQSTKVIVDDCFHTVLNKPVLENKVGASEEV